MSRKCRYHGRLGWLIALLVLLAGLLFLAHQAGWLGHAGQLAAHKGLWGSCHPTPTDSGGYVSNPI